jgi:hypothetical protein
VSESKLMAVFLNGVAQIEFDRSRELSDFQNEYLANMDAKMDHGIVLGETTLQNPDVMERVKFVAGNLLHAIKGNDEASAAAFSSYIGTRLPDLKQVRMTDINDEVSIELVFDQEYRRPISIPVTTLDS